MELDRNHPKMKDYDGFINYNSNINTLFKDKDEMFNILTKISNGTMKPPHM
jgi:hypothetical protein